MVHPFDSNFLVEQKMSGSDIQQLIREAEIEQCWTPATDLSGKSTLGVGVETDLFFQPRNLSDLHRIRRFSERQNCPLTVVGGGSNVLFTENAREHVLVELSEPTFTGVDIDVEEEEGAYEIQVGAGKSLPPLVRKAVDKGWFTFGRLTGIPGTVGGAVHGNSGTRMGEIGEFVRKVHVLHPDRPEKNVIDHPEFSYRSSSLQEEIVVEVELAGGNREEDLSDPPHEQIQSNRNESQPISERSAGCMFKNPDHDSAGRLIDEAGLKGFEVGNARVSDVHANFLVNEGGAQPDDVLELIRTLQDRVAAEYEVQLEPEIRII